MEVRSVALNDKDVLEYVQVNNAYTKRASAALRAHAARQKQAAEVTPEVVRVLVDRGYIGAHETKQAEAAFADPVKVLDLFRKFAMHSRPDDGLTLGHALMTPDTPTAPVTKVAHETPFTGGRGRYSDADDAFVAAMNGR